MTAIEKVLGWIGVVIVIFILIGLTGCASSTQTYVDERVGEWISPEGVHYWVFGGANRFGMAPRYNSEGNLIIDE